VAVTSLATVAESSGLASTRVVRSQSWGELVVDSGYGTGDEDDGGKRYGETVRAHPYQDRTMPTAAATASPTIVSGMR